ncbi:type IV pilin protein [Chroococcidiopsis thermalis]|uniref:General secretion pathway protein H n=1 Tax=Chroococcidiopsis thermalis (strain PCC 7203) TaxID=251229 RepID=K9TZI7_CHRTP|nr:type IV pilin-like G/H family protein [Chroococcidiopsis thermalis]AFY87773.1 general secretion pathway protein H [Chroococcidiopsis thermalis PCC 7203]
MKSELKVKYLQFLLGKKKDSNEGFTLIELLVVVIIIGVLAAIALPNFLNQTAKAKQAEAKTTISQVNNAQALHRNTNNGFASAMSELALGLPESTSNYTYAVTGGGDTAQILATAANSAMKGYTGANVFFKDANSNSVIATIACEANTAGTGTPADPVKSTTATTLTGAASCPGTQTQIK